MAEITLVEETLPRCHAQRIASFPPSMWLEITSLVAKHQAVNLGKGFPNWAAPEFVQRALHTACSEGEDGKNRPLQQYTRAMGHPRLVKAICDTFSPLMGRSLDPEVNVLCSVGGAEALFAAVMAFVDPGDEVIVIEPYFDFYPSQIEMAGGVPVCVPLRPSAEVAERVDSKNLSSRDLVLDIEELRCHITDKTRMMILNTPHNPTGKIFTRAELEDISAVVKQHNLILLSDEVYEWMALDENEHVRSATLKGMWDRTITVGSAGKSFSVTGWKVGWAIGPARLIEAMWRVHQFVCFTIATPLQEAVGDAFEQCRSNNYFKEFSTMLQQKRDRLVDIVNQAGMRCFVPQGSYFLFVDTSDLLLPQEALHPNETRDYSACRYLIEKHQIATIPPSAFYSKPHRHLAENYLRLCFCKTDDVLADAEKKFMELKQSQDTLRELHKNV